MPFDGVEIPPICEGVRNAAKERQLTLTKPTGALGRLEELSIRLATATGKLQPSLHRKAVIVMAGDHGVTAKGVSAYPADVTPQMVVNFLHGGAAINVLARQAGARVCVVDVGVMQDLPEHPGLRIRKVLPGTRDMSVGPAMTRDEACAALQVGVDAIREEAAKGLDIVAVGEMGIGNTTPASAITAVFTGLPVSEVTGRGTGLDDAGVKRKVAVIERAIEVNHPDPTDPIDVLSKVGGLEIAGMAGVFLGAASMRVPAVIDGFVSGAAALVAAEIDPRVKPYLFASHQSVEIGHRLALERMGLQAFLDLEMRLGEGTGAVLAFPILEAAVRTLNEMATFAEAGVSDRE